MINHHRVLAAGLALLATRQSKSPPMAAAAEVNPTNTAALVDGIACPLVWMPVCGSDGNVYGNSCEAGASGIDVLYDMGANDVAAGDRICEVTTATDYCSGVASCEDCLNNEGCGHWSVGQCMTDCGIMDAACYTEEYFEGMTTEEICNKAENDSADDNLCGSKDDCTSCVEAGNSNGEPACMWFSDLKYCSSGCDMNGCGETSCPAALPSLDPNDATSTTTTEATVGGFACFDVWAPVCGSDGKVYGNSCEADGSGIDVLYDIDPNDESIMAAGDRACEVTTATDYCSGVASCEDCLNNKACGHWSVGQCMPDCEVMDAACYTEEYFEGMTAEEICNKADNDSADDNLCGSKDDCSSCVEAVQSDGQSTCMWFSDLKYCSSECDIMNDCGETTCPEVLPGTTTSTTMSPPVATTTGSEDQSSTSTTSSTASSTTSSTTSGTPTYFDSSSAIDTSSGDMMTSTKCFFCWTSTFIAFALTLMW